MTQLPLNITQTFSYEPGQFLVHQGVQEVYAAARAVLMRQSATPSGNPVPAVFQTLFVYGPARSGKTHLMLRLADELSRGELGGGDAARMDSLRRYPRLVESTAELNWNSLLSVSPSADDVYFIDAAERSFSSLAPGSSGPFVRFVEELRRAGATLLFFSAQLIDELPCDDHVKSRLRAGQGPEIRPPSDHEMRSLVRVLARQRGIALSDRKLAFLERRLPRDIRQLEEYLDRVQFISHVTGKPIRFPVLGDAL
jgi:chromosomal replication initiation ATPase DnaA